MGFLLGLCWGYIRNNEKENGNYCLGFSGFRGLGLRLILKITLNPKP